MPRAMLDRLSLAFGSLIDGLCDPRRRRCVALALICAYAVAWTLYGVISRSSQDINADMAEQVIWARNLALGYPKHPPFLTYVVKLWFLFFPLTDWAFTLLAAVTVSAGIYLAFELCGIWLDDEKRAATPFLLAVIPFYNFLGLKFDHNSALIPLWALTMLAFMRSLETRGIGWAVTTGLAASAAILTKYWSGFLLAALAITALLDRRRNDYLRSDAPWLTAFILLLSLQPHLAWLVHEGFPPLTYVTRERMANSVADFTNSLFEFVAGTIGYASVALALVIVLIRPSMKAVRDSWFTSEPTRRPATLLFWTPLLLPLIVAFVLQVNLISIWNSPSLSLLPVMMLASPLVVVSRTTLVRLAAIVTAITLIAVVISPLVAMTVLKTGVENDAAYTRLAAAAIEREWRQTTDSPLRLVAGPFALADSAAFYITDKPSTFADFGSIKYSSFSRNLSPWINRTRIVREGIAIICEAADDLCLKEMDQLTAAGPSGRRSELTLTRHWLGLEGSARRFVIATVPPAS
jgi:hypothetical protein